MATVEQHGPFPTHQLFDRRSIAYSAALLAGLSAATIGYLGRDAHVADLSFAGFDAPRPQGTLAEELMHDLKNLDRALADYRFARAWRCSQDSPECGGVDNRLSRALDDLKWLANPSKREGYRAAFQPAFDAWRKSIADIRAFSACVRSGAEVSEDQETEFLLACGVAKGALEHLERGKIFVPDKRRAKQPLIMSVTEAPVTGEVTIDHAIGDVLWKLYWLEQIDKQRLNIGITNSETGLVTSLRAEAHPDLPDPILYVNFRNALEIDGKQSFLDMPMRQTTERRGVNLTGVGLTSSGKVTVRNRLTEEAPVKPEFSVGQYDFCFVVQSNPLNSAETTLRVSVSSEVTFYAMTGTGMDDVGYRSNVLKKSEERLIERRDGSLQRAFTLFNGLMNEGPAALKGISLPECEAR